MCFSGSIPKIVRENVNGNANVACVMKDKMMVYYEIQRNMLIMQ